MYICDDNLTNYEPRGDYSSRGFSVSPLLSRLTCGVAHG